VSSSVRPSAAIEEEWADLAERVSAPPFLRPGWFHAWTAAFGGRPLEHVTVRDNGRLEAILPVERVRGGLRSPTNWHTPAFGPVAVDGEACAAVLRDLFDHRCTSVELNLLDESSAGSDEVASTARDAGRGVVSRTVANSPFIELKGTLKDYEGALSRNRRRGLRRQRRKLEEEGDLRLEVHDGSERLDGLLEHVFRLEASGWKGESGTAIASQPETLAFYTDVARWAAAQGWLRLVLLCLDDRPIACDYALEHAGTWYTLKAGYDESLRSSGPGAVLLWAELAHCYEHGVKRIDLLGEQDEFKASWTDQTTPRIWLRAMRRNPVGLATWTAMAATEAARPLARRLKRKLS
jgi:CelD/BcsL family acetyltransferase involved in cellulose biosynthesis